MNAIAKTTPQLLKVGDVFQVVEYRYKQAVLRLGILYVQGLYGTVTNVYTITDVFTDETGETVYRAYLSASWNDRGTVFQEDEGDVIEVRPSALDNRGKLHMYFRWTTEQIWEHLSDFRAVNVC